MTSHTRSAHAAAPTAALIDELDRRCAHLWTEEPVDPKPDRTTVLRRLAAIERRVATCALRSITESAADGADLRTEVERCQRYLDELSGNWPTPVAA